MIYRNTRVDHWTNWTTYVGFALHIALLVPLIISHCEAAPSDSAAQNSGTSETFESIPLQFVERVFAEAGSSAVENGTTRSSNLRHDVKRAIDLYQRRNSRDALKVAQDITKQLKSTPHAPTKVDVAVSILTAELQIANGEYRHALLSIMPIEVRDSTLLVADHASRCAIAISVCKTLRLNAKFDEAIEQIQTVVENSDPSTQRDQSLMVESYIELAKAKYERGEIGQSIAFCQDAKEILEASPHKSNRQIVRLLLLSSENDIEGLQLAIAKTKLIEARSILDESKYSSSPEFVELLSLEWRIAYLRRDIDASTSYALEAASLAGRVYSVNHPIYASCLRRLAQSKFAIGERQAAIQEVKKAYAIHNKALGSFHPEIAFDAKAFAELVEAEQPDLAAEFLKRGGEILQKSNCSFGYAPLLHGRAKLAIRNGKYDDAKRYMSDAVAIDEATFGHSSLRFMQTQRLWANCIAAAGNLDEAQRTFDRLRHEFPEEATCDVEYARLLADSAACELARTRLDEAESLSANALEIFSELDEASFAPVPQYEKTARTYAKVLVQKKRYQEAINQFQRAIVLQGRDSHTDPSTTAETYYLIGLTHLANNQADKAAQSLDNSIQCYAKVLGAESPRLTPLYHLRDEVRKKISQKKISQRSSNIIQ